MPASASSAKHRGRADHARRVAAAKAEAARSGLSVALDAAAITTANPGVAALLRAIARAGRESRRTAREESGDP